MNVFIIVQYKQTNTEILQLPFRNRSVNLGHAYEHDFIQHLKLASFIAKLRSLGLESRTLFASIVGLISR